ncbi:hypothetical protein V5F77_02495 [Xanthobacter sp. DSM 24535]|uniref:hypothetical protein n=1 Tax=Roseixanthobacter psychrophilus TaxID=3119917 RepID=UPI0037266A03
MNMHVLGGPRLRKNDLVAASDEPRIADLTLAQRLGFEKPHNIRRLIDRNRAELESYGALLPNILRGGEKRTRGRPGAGWLLNEGQALVICALSRTPVAAAVRQELVRVFMLFRCGCPVTLMETQALRDLCELAHVFTQGPRRFLLAPVTSAILDALAAFQALDEDAEESDEGGNDDEQEDDDLDTKEGETDEDREPVGWASDPDQSHLGYSSLDDEEPSLGATENLQPPLWFLPAIGSTKRIAFGSQEHWGDHRGMADAEGPDEDLEPDWDAELEEDHGIDDVPHDDARI